jgi:hypothetical protein
MWLQPFICFGVVMAASSIGGGVRAFTSSTATTSGGGGTTPSSTHHGQSQGGMSMNGPLLPGGGRITGDTALINVHDEHDVWWMVRPPIEHRCTLPPPSTLPSSSSLTPSSSFHQSSTSGSSGGLNIGSGRPNLAPSQSSSSLLAPSPSMLLPGARTKSLAVHSHHGLAPSFSMSSIPSITAAATAASAGYLSGNEIYRTEFKVVAKQTSSSTSRTVSMPVWSAGGSSASTSGHGSMSGGSHGTTGGATIKSPFDSLRLAPNWHRVPHLSLLVVRCENADLYADQLRPVIRRFLQHHHHPSSGSHHHHHHDGHHHHGIGGGSGSSGPGSSMSRTISSAVGTMGGHISSGLGLGSQSDHGSKTGGTTSGGGVSGGKVQLLRECLILYVPLSNAASASPALMSATTNAAAGPMSANTLTASSAAYGLPSLALSSSSNRPSKVYRRVMERLRSDFGRDLVCRLDPLDTEHSMEQQFDELVHKIRLCLQRSFEYRCELYEQEVKRVLANSRLPGKSFICCERRILSLPS